MKSDQYELPPLRSNTALPAPWFPSEAHCFIYRSWECVTAERMAKVLNTTVETVKRMAEDMGLEPEVSVPAQWLTQGYITLIRSNWHLLTYGQLCTLLGWREEQLAFILREDDFLGIKLGSFKPEVAPLRVRPLTEEETKRLERVRQVTAELRSKLPQGSVRPFDFFAKTVFPKGEPPKSSRVRLRMLYSYCALYGDTFLDRSLIDLSFPEEMLRSYQSMGINALWTQAVLSKLTPYPFAAREDHTYLQRQEGVRYLIRRLAKYGIKLYFYLNEPRALPDSAFDQFPHLRGHRHPAGDTCLCVRREEVQSYLRESVAHLVRSAPGLGGLFTIVASENHTHCLNDAKASPNCNCPRCRAHTRAENFALVNRLICEGAHSADPSVDVIAFGWEWGEPEATKDVIRQLPTDMAVMSVSEGKMEKTLGGVTTRVRDYSISVEGPSPFSLGVWQAAANHGNEGIAKLQVNNSWELSPVPYIPVFEKYYSALKRILESGTVNGLMLTWTLGGYPSPVLEAVGRLCAAEGELPTLRELYGQVFAGADLPLLEQALHLFSEAFDAYPFSVQFAYNGPQHCAPANLLYPHPIGLPSTMVCFPYDDLEEWRGVFPREVFLSQLRLVCETWEQGLRLLERVDVTANPYLPELLETSVMCLVHLRCTLNQCEWVNEKRDSGDWSALLQSERELTLRALELVPRNATFGYESSNHYFYTKQSLMEKLINCDWLMGMTE